MMADEIFHCGAKLINVSDLNVVLDMTEDFSPKALLVVERLEEL